MELKNGIKSEAEKLTDDALEGVSGGTSPVDILNSLTPAFEKNQVVWANFGGSNERGYILNILPPEISNGMMEYKYEVSKLDQSMTKIFRQSELQNP